MIAFETRGQTRTARLWFALAIAGTIFVAEVGGSMLAGSLALLADAGHLLNDVLGIAMALARRTSGAARRRRERPSATTARRFSRRR